MDPALVRRLRREMSVHAEVGAVDPTAAGQGLAERLGVGLSRLSPSMRSSSEGSSFFARSSSRTYVIVATGRAPSGALFVREAVLDFAQRRTPGYTIDAWVQRSAAEGREPIVPDTGGLPPC
jgi:hypothetical protein